MGSFRTGHGKDLDSFFGFMDAKMWMICLWLCCCFDITSTSRLVMYFVNKLVIISYCLGYHT